MTWGEFEIENEEIFFMNFHIYELLVRDATLSWGIYIISTFHNDQIINLNKILEHLKFWSNYW